MYKTIRYGLDNYKQLRSYELKGQVIHVLYSKDNGIDYLLTWPKGPIVEVKLLNGLQPQSIRMMLKFLNSMSGTLRLEKMV